MTRFAALLAVALVTLSGFCRGNDAALALQDRATLPVERQPFARYVTTEHLEEIDRRHAEAALCFVLPSMSRQTVLERCLPVRVGETLLRIDLADLGWDLATWRDVTRAYPYRLGTLKADGARDSLTLRLDWLLVQLTDAHQSDAYYRLLFGDPVPKTRDEALARLGVLSDPQLQFGMIEGQSGVSVQGVRLVSNLAAPRGYAYSTRDLLSLAPDQDPLEQPEGDFRHDGEEWIIGLPKTHMATGVRGALQAYFLANGQGTIVDRAPVDLVEDHSRFRGLAEIRTAGSCIGCHANGLNPLKRNELRAVLTSGVQALAYYDDQQAVEAFHFADLAKELHRDNEDYAAIVRCATGAEPSDVTWAYLSTVGAYDKPLDLATAARELGADAEELKLALGRASALGVRLGARLSSLAHGGKVPRVAWEQNYLTVEQLFNAWEQGQ